MGRTSDRAVLRDRRPVACENIDRRCETVISYRAARSLMIVSAFQCRFVSKRIIWLGAIPRSPAGIVRRAVRPGEISGNQGCQSIELRSKIKCKSERQSSFQNERERAGQPSLSGRDGLPPVGTAAYRPAGGRHWTSGT